MTVCYWCGSKDTLADVGKELDDGKYKMVQCSKCKNAYYVVNKEKTNKPKPMTNEEYLRSCNTEQLAEWIASVVQKAISIKESNSIVMLESAIWWGEWLKQPRQLTTK